jgi:hypothetical protein
MNFKLPCANCLIRGCIAKEFYLVQHPVELIPGFDNTVPIIAVHNKDETLGVLEIMPPQRPDLVLTPHIPDGEADVLVLHGFNIESDGGDGGDDLAELELVEDCGLSGRVKTHHQDPHLLLGEEPAEQLGEREPHLFSRLASDRRARIAGGELAGAGAGDGGDGWRGEAMGWGGGGIVAVVRAYR